MARQQNATAEVMMEAPERGYTLARLISQIFHPLTLSTFTLVLVGCFSHVRWWIGILWALLTVLIQVVPAALFFLIRLNQGAYSDDDVSVREQRNELYLFTILASLVSLTLLVLLHAPQSFVAIVCAGIILGVINWQINVFWKISAHASALGLSATIATIYVPPLGIVLWGCAPIVGWARVKTRNHTVLQVLVGFGLSSVILLVTFMFFDLV